MNFSKETKEKNMKVQIRGSVFETNSSSTHSLVITSTDDWNKFNDGEYVYESLDCWQLANTGKFVSREQAMEDVKEVRAKDPLGKDCPWIKYDADDEDKDAWDKCILDKSAWDSYHENHELIEDSLNGVTAISIYGWD